MSIYPNPSKRIPAVEINNICDKIVQNVTINQNGCWIWNGSRLKSGYGKIKVKGVDFYAHRVSSELWHDDFNPSLLVCHECPEGHDKACMNPWHLKQGTQTYNMNNEATKQLIRERALEAIQRRQK